VKGYPRTFPRLLWSCLAALFISGLLLAPVTLEMRLEWEVPPWSLFGSRIWLGASHAAFAFVFMGLVGALSVLHIRSGWRRKRNIVSGLLVLTIFALLAVTALGVYYLGDERLAMWTGVAHLVLGLIAPLPFAQHYFHGWRLRAEATSSSGRHSAAWVPQRPPLSGGGSSQHPAS
jgi:hypothetical protein